MNMREDRRAETETEVHRSVGRAEQGEMMGPGLFKHNPQNMEEATLRQNVSLVSTSIWW